MKFLMFTLVCLLTGAPTLTAQDDFYLPVSSTSEKAKALLIESEELIQTALFPDAYAKIEEALAEDPNLFMAYVVPIHINPAEALEKGLVDKALAIDPANFNQAEQIIRSQYLEWKKNGASSAAGSLQALVAAYPNVPQAYNWASVNAGMIDGNMPLAIKYAEKLAQLKPDFAPNYNTLGYAYLGNKDLKAAKKAFEKQLKLIPNEANPYDSMADYYMAAKDYKNAAKYYDMAAERGMDGAKERAEKARGI